MSNKTGKYVFLRNAELNWAKLVTPVAPFGTPNYELQAATTDKAIAKEWSDLGFKIKTMDGKYIVNLKRKAVKANGDENTKVNVFDGALNPLDGDKIGNGSTGNIKVYQYPYEYAGKSGISNSLTAVQVTNLVEYTGGSAADGFEAFGDNKFEDVKLSDEEEAVFSTDVTEF